MDGAKSQPQHVFVLAATNRRDSVDPAVLSRFTKTIEVPAPTIDAVKSILRLMLQGKPLAFSLEEELDALAQRGVGRSGRDLKNWVENAEQAAILRCIDNPEDIAVELADFP